MAQSQEPIGQGEETNGNGPPFQGDPPVVIQVISKRLRNAKKRLRGIDEIQSKSNEGKALNVDQEYALQSRPVVIAVVEELEKLLSLLEDPIKQDAKTIRSQALEEAAAAKPPPTKPPPTKPPPTKPPPTKSPPIPQPPVKTDKQWEEEKKAAVDKAIAKCKRDIKETSNKQLAAAKTKATEDTINTLIDIFYFASAFDPSSPTAFERLIFLDSAALYQKQHPEKKMSISHEDFNMIIAFGKLLSSKPPHETSLSHKDALAQCKDRATKLVTTSSDVFETQLISGAALKDKIEDLKALDFFSYNPGALPIPISSASSTIKTPIPLPTGPAVPLPLSPAAASPSPVVMPPIQQQNTHNTKISSRGMVGTMPAHHALPPPLTPALPTTGTTSMARNNNNNINGGHSLGFDQQFASTTSTPHPPPQVYRPVPLHQYAQQPVLPPPAMAAPTQPGSKNSSTPMEALNEYSTLPDIIKGSVNTMDVYENIDIAHASGYSIGALAMSDAIARHEVKEAGYRYDPKNRIVYSTDPSASVPLPDHNKGGDQRQQHQVSLATTTTTTANTAATITHATTSTAEKQQSIPSFLAALKSGNAQLPPSRTGNIPRSSSSALTFGGDSELGIEGVPIDDDVEEERKKEGKKERKKEGKKKEDEARRRPIGNEMRKKGNNDKNTQKKEEEQKEKKKGASRRGGVVVNEKTAHHDNVKQNKNDDGAKKKERRNKNEKKETAKTIHLPNTDTKPKQSPATSPVIENKVHHQLDEKKKRKRQKKKKQQNENLPSGNEEKKEIVPILLQVKDEAPLASPPLPVVVGMVENGMVEMVAASPLSAASSNLANKKKQSSNNNKRDVKKNAATDGEGKGQGQDGEGIVAQKKKRNRVRKMRSGGSKDEVLKQ